MIDRETIIETQNEYICGVGAANVDIHGKSRKSIIMRDSNPGFMKSSAGGVTRNVCENLARLGDNVKLISAVGDDVYAEKIKADSAQAGIDISNLYTVKDHVSSTYISILDENGDMLVALSDMRILEELPLDYLRSKADLIRKARVVTIDPSLPYESIEEVIRLCEPSKTPVFMDPVSSAYAAKIKPLIGHFHTVKPNEMELSILSGIPVKEEADYEKAAAILIEKGVERVFTSRGKKGCFYMDAEGNIIRKAFKPLEKMVNATGAGDSFMAGIIHSYVNGYDIDKTLDYALAAGAVAVMSEKTINPQMSVEEIQRVIEERK